MSPSRPADPDALAFAFRWPGVAGLEGVESAFAGAFHPTRPLAVSLDPAADGPPLRRFDGDRWFLVAPESPLHAGGHGLIHDIGGAGVAFRGYVTEPPLHSHSPSNEVASYWLERAEGRHNGVFAAAVLDAARGRATLTTDALGLGPIYYRLVDGALLFASNPRLLAMRDDEPDLLAWRSVLSWGSMASDRSMSRDVRRLPAGACVSLDREGLAERSWFDFAEFPCGGRPLDDAAFREVEDRFEQAVARCLRLDNGRALLPLSSGFDSRRILAQLQRQGAQPLAVTARVFQKGDRDLDAPIAERMARDLGIPHRIVEPADEGQYAIDDGVRQQLLDGESGSHTWVVRFLLGLPREPTLLFDGVLGDVLGNPGFRMAGLYESTERDLELLLADLVRGNFARVLAPDRWPSPGELREDLTGYLRPWMSRRNMAEFAFLLLRQRRMTSCWSQQLLPAGHVPVNPYADLDYLSLLFGFDPEAKHATPIQRECLRRFWPDLYRYPGSRDVPEDSVPVAQRYSERIALAADRAMRGTLGRGGLAELGSWCSPRGRALLRLSRWSERAALHWDWFLQPLMAFMIRNRRDAVAWSRAAAPTGSGPVPQARRAHG